jgi:ketosteroid isomerase-like protein
MRYRLALCCAILGLSACNAPPPALSAAEVQQFVRDYAAATNSADTSKVMSMVLHEETASSIAGGKMERGWEAMRVSTGVIREQKRGEVVVGTIEVAPLSADAAVAVGTLNIRGIRHIGDMVVDNLPVAFSIVVKRTPQGLRLVQEHYSIRTR